MDPDHPPEPCGTGWTWAADAAPVMASSDPLWIQMKALDGKTFLPWWRQNPNTDVADCITVQGHKCLGYLLAGRRVMQQCPSSPDVWLLCFLWGCRQRSYGCLPSLPAACLPTLVVATAYCHTLGLPLVSQDLGVMHSGSISKPCCGGAC